MSNKNDIQKIRKILEEVLIEYISEEVIKKLIERNKKALVVFTGASIGFNQSIKALNDLKNQGWQFEIILSEGAQKALGEDLIKKLLHVEDVEMTRDKYNFVIVPTLTINTASKIANCISDNTVTNIISKAISSKIPVIASINACCPDNEERKAMGFFPTEAYRNKLISNLDYMRSYGMNLTTSESLAQKVNKVFRNKYNLSPAIIHKNVSKQEEETIKVDDKIISRGCVLNNSNFSVIKINKDSVITALAKDEAQKLNIKLMKE